MLQTNNTGVCSQCLSRAGPAPAHGTHCSGSRLFCREPSEAGPGLHAPPRSKLLRLRHSVSPWRCRLGWACVLCPSQVRVAQAFGECGRFHLSPFPSLLLSFLGVQLAPLISPLLGDCPEPQEFLVSKEACLQFGRFSGAAIAPLPALPALAACHRRGMVCSGLILLCPLFCARSWWCLMLELFAQ